MEKTIKNPVLTCESKNEMEVLETYLKGKGMYYEKSDNYVTIYHTFTLNELKFLMDIDKVTKINRRIAISKIMLNWFGIDSILNNIDYTRENMIRYDNMRDSWCELRVSYSFNAGRERLLSTTNPITALRWMQAGMELVMVEGLCQREWEEEFGIEKDFY